MHIHRQASMIKMFYYCSRGCWLNVITIVKHAIKTYCTPLCAIRHLKYYSQVTEFTWSDWFKVTWSVIIIQYYIIMMINILISSFGLDTVYPIILDNVDCSTSNYLTILQCGHSTFISSSCDHGSDDVSVTCCKLLTNINIYHELNIDAISRYNQNLEQPIWWSDTFARLTVH